MNATVIVIDPPSPVVSVEEARRHLRIDHDDDDATIEALVASATAWIDGPDGWLGRALGGQILEWQGRCWPCRDFALPYPPLVEVLSVTYVDPAGVTQPWDFPTPLHFESMPAVRGRRGDVKIRYRAGYGSFNGDDPPVWVNAVPPPIRHAILMLVAHWYENRETVVVGTISGDLPFAVNSLLAPFRRLGI